MVISGLWRGNPLTISLRDSGLIVSVGAPDRAAVISYDGAGRLWSIWHDGRHYRRGLNGRVLSKWRDNEGVRQREWLDTPNARTLEEQAHALLATLYADFTTGAVPLNVPLPREGHFLLARAVTFDPAHSQSDTRRYTEIYKPIGILPPDQYMAVVLQLTEGCSFNTCTFCDFYRDRPFRVKGDDEFQEHLRAVKDYLGDGLKLRRGIFLADANAMVIPMSRLVKSLDTISNEFDTSTRDGVYAFLDGFSGAKKSDEDYQQLARRGLRRVYIGLESGSARLLSFLRKPGKPEDVIRAVVAMKAGGVSVGIIILLGAGGRQFSTEHVEDTVAVLNALPLDQSDLIYFSDLVEHPVLAYTRQAREAGLVALTLAEREQQEDQIRQGLRWAQQAARPRISRYDIREFIY